MNFCTKPYRLLTAVALLTACDVKARSGGTGVDIPIAQIVVAPDTLTLDPQQSFPFRAFGRTDVGDSVPVSVHWAASAGPISQAGTYTADTSAADVVVTATLISSGVSGSSRVKKRRVVQLVINPHNTALNVGAVQQFSVYGRRNTGDSVSVPVTYSATGGTVSGNGVYTAGPTAGSFRVIANQSNGALADTSAVTVSTVPVASVVVSPASGTLTPGGTLQLSVSTRDSAGNPLSGRLVSWSSSAPAVATVSANGLVAGVVVGSATITATSEGQSGTAAITVATVPVASVTVSPASASVAIGANGQLSAVTKDSAGGTLTGRVVTWSSSNTAVATVNSSGLVTGVTAGSATITATSEGKSGTATITVAVAVVPVASVTVSPASASLFVAGTRQLSAVTKDSAGTTLTGRVVTWASSNTTVATVTSSGLVTGRAAGSATITATSEGKSGTAAVTVMIVPVASVTVSPSAATVVVGGTQQLSAVTKDSAGSTLTGRVVTWASSNTAVATVSASGLVTGVAAGSATITATSEGKTGTATVTVQTPPTVTGDTIALQIVRMDGGSGMALVSNGIPLPKGKLTPTNTAHVLLLVGGVERSIHVEALAGRYPDGSVRALLLQFQYAVSTGSPIPALLITGPSVTRTTTDLPKTTVTGNIPAAVALPTSASYLVSTEVVGQTIARAAAPTSPAAFPTYESQFVSYGNSHWASEAGNWLYNYYDRALIWYAWWVRTGDPEYWRRGTIDAVAYRQYLAGSDYLLQPHDAQMEGVALHYLLTGDETSRFAIGKVAYLFSWMWTPYINCTQCTSNGGQYVEGRIQGRTLMSHYLAWMIDAVGDQPTNWVTTMATDVTNILSTQQPDGSYRFVMWEGAHSNYMTGLMHDALIKYYTYVQADARIPPAIKKTLDWMWATQWVASAQAFKYVSEPMSTGGTTPYPDLNGLIVTGYGWYYQFSHDATYKTRGDAIFDGGTGAWLDGYKQFNQTYTQSYRYLFYRR